MVVFIYFPCKILSRIPICWKTMNNVERCYTYSGCFCGLLRVTTHKNYQLMGKSVSVDPHLLPLGLIFYHFPCKILSGIPIYWKITNNRVRCYTHSGSFWGLLRATTRKDCQLMGKSVSADTLLLLSRLIFFHNLNDDAGRDCERCLPELFFRDIEKIIGGNDAGIGNSDRRLVAGFVI